MKRLFKILKILALLVIMINIYIFIVIIINLWINDKIFKSSLYLFLIIVNIWLAVKANRVLNDIALNKGFKYGIFYLLIGYVVYLFSNFALCTIAIRIY